MLPRTHVFCAEDLRRRRLLRRRPALHMHYTKPRGTAFCADSMAARASSVSSLDDSPASSLMSSLAGSPPVLPPHIPPTSASEGHSSLDCWDTHSQTGNRTYEGHSGLASRQSADLNSPAPPLTNAVELFNLEREVSTLLHIMDELEEMDECDGDEHEAVWWQQCTQCTHSCHHTASIEEALKAAEASLLSPAMLPEELADEASALPAEASASPAEVGGTMVPFAREGEGGSSIVPYEAKVAKGSLATGHMEFQCKCPGGSCLQNLTGRQLKQAYVATHPQGDGTSPSVVNSELHVLLWGMKEPLPRGTNGRGHTHRIRYFEYDAKPLCRRGWQVVFAASDWGMRQATALVLRGISPQDVKAERGTALLLATANRAEAEATEKQMRTSDWLRKVYLSTMEYMPNENRIVLRGASTTFVHREQYTIAAKKGGYYLSYKQFMGCMHAAAVACSEFDHSGENSKNVKVSRSAKHSNFPMCTTCDVLSENYIKEYSDPLADPRAVQRKRDEMLAHQTQFMADRTMARRLRYATYDARTSSDLYECDDKCGSFWCKIPVVPRQNKENTKQVYEFAVQANVVCGPGGVIRLSIIPKTVNTGANFGLSTLLGGLYAAFKGGRLQPHVRRLLRHTDGGSDNVAKVTHIFNWLLVYVGCWEEVLWFIFDAGHSHTEIADRLFSLMKKIFETDSAAHVQGGVNSFEDLEERLKACFSKCPEMKEIVYHFANWDFQKWLKASVGFKESDLERISFDNVFRYRYVGALS